MYPPSGTPGLPDLAAASDVGSMTVRQVAQTIGDMKRALGAVVVDQDETLHRVLLAIACGGHVLIEDVPGVGKTTLARALAEALGLGFARIQGTTDLMPAEITGVSVWSAQRGAFEFHPGPLMHHLVLFDEINRATPKTQSALLEAMQERQVTVDGVTHQLPRPFLVLATQNPIDYAGTFPLTEAQRDRFMLQVAMGYPGPEGARRLLDTYLAPQQQAEALRHAPLVGPLLPPGALAAMLAARSAVFLDPKVRDYIVALAEATRQHPDVRLGLSPRASLMLGQAAQASAAFAGREYVTPDDVQAVFLPVGAHRLILTAQADLGGRAAAAVLTEVLGRTPAPAWPASGVPTRTTGAPPTTGTIGTLGPMGTPAGRSRPLKTTGR